MTSLRSLVLVLAFASPVLVVAAGCPGPEYPKCEKDDQCKKGKDGKIPIVIGPITKTPDPQPTKK